MALKLKPEQPLVHELPRLHLGRAGREPATRRSRCSSAPSSCAPRTASSSTASAGPTTAWATIETAIKYLEQAILLEPGEATINDHLGDAYWRVGRKLEAKYQWQHALTLKPEKDDEPKIRRKIEAGLDRACRRVPPAPSRQAGKAGQ